MIIRMVKQLTPSETLQLKTANKQTWQIATAINPYCTSLYTLISKHLQAYTGNSPIWYHPLLRAALGTYIQPRYQLKDLPNRDYSFKSLWEPKAEILRSKRELTLNNLFLEVNFVQVSEKRSHGVDLALTIVDEKQMEDTFVEHYAQLNFELFSAGAPKTLFSLANFFYDKPSLYKRTYEALVENKKALLPFLPASLIEGYLSLFSLELETDEVTAFKISQTVVDKEMLFLRSSAYDLVRQGYEPLASFRTYGESKLECIQLQLNDNGLLAIDLMLKNSYLEAEAETISSKNYEKILNAPNLALLVEKEINAWLKAIVLQASFAQALFGRLKNFVLLENI